MAKSESAPRRVPLAIRQIMRSTARSFAASLRAVGYLNGDRDAPMTERNTVVHLAHACLSRGWASYAEPSLGGREHLDLVAAGDRVALAAEVKKFGPLNVEAVHADARRLVAFRPQVGRPSGRLAVGEPPRADGVDGFAFWTSREPWGLIVVQSMLSKHLTEIWCSLLDRNRLKALLQRENETIRADLVAATPELNDFASFLTNAGGTTGAVGVLRPDEIWKDAERLDLLWAAFPIAR